MTVPPPLWPTAGGLEPGSWVFKKSLMSWESMMSFDDIPQDHSPPSPTDTLFLVPRVWLPANIGQCRMVHR